MDARARMQLGAIQARRVTESPPSLARRGVVHVEVISVVCDFHSERQTSSSATRSRSRARRYVNYYGGTASHISSFTDIPSKHRDDSEFVATSDYRENILHLFSRDARNGYYIKILSFTVTKQHDGENHVQFLSSDILT